MPEETLHLKNFILGICWNICARLVSFSICLYADDVLLSQIMITCI